MCDAAIFTQYSDSSWISCLGHFAHEVVAAETVDWGSSFLEWEWLGTQYLFMIGYCCESLLLVIQYETNI